MVSTFILQMQPLFLPYAALYFCEGQNPSRCRRGVAYVVFAPLDADGAARAARGEERIDLAHRP